MQEVIVGIIVLAAAACAIWRLLSPRMRLRLLPNGGRMSGALRRRAQAELAGGCGTCPAASTRQHDVGRRDARTSH